MSDETQTEEIALEDEAQIGTGAGQMRAGAGLSRLGELRDRYKAREADETHDFAVPGYSGELKVRMRVPDFEVTRRIELEAAVKQRRGEASSYIEVEVMMDELIHACDCLLALNPATGEYEPITQGDGGPLVTIGHPAVKDMLGLEWAQEARDVVMGLFAHANGRARAPHLIGDFYSEWLAWFKRSRDGTAASLAGE